MPPHPRPHLLNPQLQRPDWLTTAPRPEGVIWLDKNENIDPELQSLTHRVLGEVLPSALNTYPDCRDVYRKLAALEQLPAECFLLTAGSDGAIRIAFEAFVAEGGGVQHPAPTFAMYPVYAQM